MPKKIQWDHPKPLGNADDLPEKGLVVCSFCWAVMSVSKVDTSNDICQCPICYVDAMFVIKRSIADAMSYHNTAFGPVEI